MNVRFAYPEHQAMWSKLPHAVQLVIYAAMSRPEAHTISYANGYIDSARDYFILADAEHSFLQLVLGMAPSLRAVQPTTSGGHNNG